MPKIGRPKLSVPATTMNSTVILDKDRYSLNSLALREPKYMTIFEWERKFDLTGWRVWMSHHWTISIYVSMLYVLFIFWLQSWMRNQKPLRLTKLLVTWNSVLALFSLMVFVRTLPEFLFVITAKNGFHNSVCHWIEHNHATAFWSWLFIISKVPELGDTVFVVLRKQKLIFLHWYHHAVTLISCWVVYEAYEPHQQWSVVMNSFVHSIMYSYYGLKAMGVKVPRSLALVITSFQLLQMVVGIGVSLYSLNILLHGHGKCDRAYFGHQVPLVIYATYLFLFAHFFYLAYLKPKGKLTTSNGITKAIANGNGITPNGSCNGIGNGNKDYPSEETISLKKVL